MGERSEKKEAEGSNKKIALMIAVAVILIGAAAVALFWRNRESDPAKDALASSENGDGDADATQGAMEPGEESDASQDSQDAEEESDDAQDAAYIESVFVKYKEVVTPSVGEVGIPYFIVDFQDVKYTDALASKEELEEWLFTGTRSFADYYSISSHGRLQLSGDVYFYTASGDMASYETGEALEQLVMEMLDSFEDEVDFSKYDKNGDEVIDALMLSVPKGGDPGFWWGATHTWYANPDYTVDGLYLVKYVVNDDQPYQESKKYFLNTVEHEFGHCLGLPDYYKYEYTGSDFEGMHGMAGKERMDDSEGDFCQFSKLLLGWLTEEQVQIMPSDVEEAEFFLPPVKDGGCLLIFPKDQEPNFQGEYFVVEYNTQEGLWAGVIEHRGIRVLHAQAELLDYDGGYFDFKYGNFSEYYDTSNEGIRVLKLVRDGRTFFREDSTITYENTGGEKGNFGWYTEDGSITEPGFHIEVGKIQEDGTIQVKVLWD